MKKLMKLIFSLAVIGIISILMINYVVTSSTNKQIISIDDVTSIDDIDCIIVLGCQVKSDGSLSLMLKDRLDKAIEVYNQTNTKLLMSGDHGTIQYDEVNAMKNYAISQNIASSEVFMDHAGFSTYESIYRAKDVFQADKIIIISQEYHLYRALYIANQLGIDAYGVSCDDIKYSGQTQREIREVLARYKDYFSCLFKVKPTYLGEVIDLNQSGDLTND